MPTLEFGAAGQTSGRNVAMPDPLAAEDTWINALYAEWRYNSPRRWTTRHRFKWEWWRQRDAAIEFSRDVAGARRRDAEGEPVVEFDPLGPLARNGRGTSGFVGLIDKIDAVFGWGPARVAPRLKSEFISAAPFALTQQRQRSWDAIASLLIRFPLMRGSEIELGFEQRLFFELRRDEEELAVNVPTGDFRGMVWAVQLSNQREYLGYNLTTQLGLRFVRRSLEVVARDREARTAGLAFLSIFASL